MLCSRVVIPSIPKLILKFVSYAILAGILFFAGDVLPSFAQTKPSVRAITAFIRLDPTQYAQQVADTLTMLRNAKSRYELAGYQVDSIRIATQPFPEYTRGMSKDAVIALFGDLDKLAKQEGISICIGPALLTEKDDSGQAQTLAEILSQTTSISGSVVVAGSDGVHWKAVHAAAGVMKYLEDHTDRSLGNFRFAAIANVPAYTPGFPFAYHQGLGHQFSIMLKSANVVATVMAVQRDPEASRQALVAELGMHAAAVENIASKIDLETGWSYMGLDMASVATKEDSLSLATGGYTGGQFGASGTLTAIATITAALRDIAVKKVGYAGVMIPVLQDTRLAQLWGQGRLSMDQILGYSAAGGNGLDTIPLPGDVTAQQIEHIIGDMATLSVKVSRPLNALLLPIAGAKPGDQTAFDDPKLVNTVIQPLP